ncbi:MAG: hypothetical protein LBC74_00835 [Planctomycetaceae bacterium]|nr:hypothetical protein [Planctomycetaceae bacterium]
MTLALVSAIEAGAYADTESDGNADDKCKKGASVVYCQDHGCTLDGKNCGTPAESCPCV